MVIPVILIDWQILLEGSENFKYNFIPYQS